MPPTLRRDGDTLEVDLSTCRGFEFRDTLDKVRDMAGRRFDPERKLWLLPAEALVAEQVLNSTNALADAALREWVREARANEAADLATPLPEDADLAVPWATHRASWQPTHITIAGERQEFNGLLRHQRPAVALMARGNAILADDMGLGKTGATISAIEEYRFAHVDLDRVTLPSGPRLVVCPNSVKGAWKREINLWLEDPVIQVIDASSLKARANQLERALDEDPNVWIVANWEFIRATKVKREIKMRNGNTRTKIERQLKVPLLGETDWLAVIADEAHRAKNRKAQATWGLWMLQGALNYALTGTPLMNSPDELWPLLAWLWPDEYHERGAAHKRSAMAYHPFYDKYVDYYESPNGKVVTGVKNPDGLRFALKQRVIRRTKNQVLDLPPKMRYADPITLNPKQRKLYDEASEQMWLEIIKAAEGGDKSAQDFAKAALAGEPTTTLLRIANAASRTVRQRQIIETPANIGGDDDSAVLDSVVDKIMDSRPKPWVVYAEFKPTTACLAERLRNRGLEVATYTGDVDPEERTVLEDSFQRGELDVLIGTIMAMREGITLTASDMQYWCSRSWVPAYNEQGEDRQHRIGQSSPVSVLIAQAEDTVATDRVAPTNRLKERIVSTVIPKDHVEEATL